MDVEGIASMVTLALALTCFAVVPAKQGKVGGGGAQRRRSVRFKSRKTRRGGAGKVDDEGDELVDEPRSDDEGDESETDLEVEDDRKEGEAYVEVLTAGNHGTEPGEEGSPLWVYELMWDGDKHNTTWQPLSEIEDMNEEILDYWDRLGENPTHPVQGDEILRYQEHPDTGHPGYYVKCANGCGEEEPIWHNIVNLGLVLDEIDAFWEKSGKPCPHPLAGASKRPEDQRPAYESWIRDLEFEVRDFAEKLDEKQKEAERAATRLEQRGDAEEDDEERAIRRRRRPVPGFLHEVYGAPTEKDKKREAKVFKKELQPTDEEVFGYAYFSEEEKKLKWKNGMNKEYVLKKSKWKSARSQKEREEAYDRLLEAANKRRAGMKL